MGTINTHNGMTNDVNISQGMPTPEDNCVAIDIRGTFVGTLQFEATVDSLNWVSVSAYVAGSSSSTAVTSTTAPGVWVANVAGFRTIRVRSSAWTSGTATIVLRGETTEAPFVVTPAGGGGGGGVVTQPDATQLNSQVQGNSPSAATDVGNPVKIAGVFNTTLPTFTAAQRGDVQISARGEQIVTLSTGGTPIVAQGNATSGVTASATARHIATIGYQYIFNGTSWDQQRKANVFNRVASSAAAGNPAVGKASAGDVKQFWGLNTTAAVVYLQIYNTAVAPTLGTSTPSMTYPIPASAGFSQTLPDGAYFPTGIAYAFTTDAAGATGVAAGAITAFNLLVA